MLTFDRYLFKKILLTTIIGVIFMSSLALSGQLIKEIQEIFSLDGNGVSILFQFLILTFPYMLAYMLPWAFLTAILLTLNSLSSKNEIISIRMTGQSHLRIAIPILILGALFSGLLYYTNGTVTPSARLKTSDLLNPDQITKGGVKLSPQFLNKSLGNNLRVHADKFDRGEITGLHIFEFDPETQQTSTYCYARQADLNFDDQGKIIIDAKKVYIESKNNQERPEPIFSERIHPLTITHEKRTPSSRAKYQTNNKIIDFLKKDTLEKEDKIDYFAELCTRISMSLSCLSFSFIAFPLGQQNKRKQNNRGFLIGIITFGLFLGATEYLNTVGDDFLVRGISIFTPHLVLLTFAFFFYRKIRMN